MKTNSAVSELPEQEIAKAELAAGADEQIGIGDARRVEIGGEALGVISSGASRRLPRPRRCGARRGRSRRGRRS